MSRSAEIEDPGRPAELPALARYAITLALVGAATLGAGAMEKVVKAPNVSLVFVLPVVIAAVSFGWGPALTAAVAGVAAYNFFFIEPRGAFDVSDPANFGALVLLLAVAGIVSAVAAQSRRRALAAWEAAERSLALEALAQSLVAASDPHQIAQASAEALARLFKAPAAVFLASEHEMAPPVLAGAAVLGPMDHEAASWALASGMSTRAGAYPLDPTDYDFWPVVTPHRQRAVIGVGLARHDETRLGPPERLVETVGGYLSVALDRQAYAQQALETRVQIARERLKTDLVAAVSHDLKTPLSTILVTLQSLRKFGDAHDAASRAELLALAEAETARLSGLVAKLLDMGRLDAGAVVVHRTPVAPDKLVADALSRAAAGLAGRVVDNQIEADAAPLMVDESLFETALANVLENAGRYSPSGSTIRILGGASEKGGWIEVLDEGPGLPEPVEPLFEKFARGVEGDGRPPGTGLGLTIARGFLEAQGGRIIAANRHDRTGARVRLTAPLAAREPLTA
jgi:two-component system sensor histidine kinase KdpD